MTGAFSERPLHADSLYRARERGRSRPPPDVPDLRSAGVGSGFRLVLDTGIHSMGWTRQQAIDFFRENSAKTEHDITVEVDRYIAWPGQALAYKLGELKIKQLRAEAERELGPKFDVRAFHDEVLAHGAIPLELLETNVRAWIARSR